MAATRHDESGRMVVLSPEFEARITWVYVRTEPRLWTVGFYDPAGKWITDSNHEWPQQAAARCRRLNGSKPEVTP